MDKEYDYILNIEKNEEFIKACFDKIITLDMGEEDFLALLDINVANFVIKDRYSYTYPIIVEVPTTGIITEEMTHIKNYRRYYSERYIYNGKAYLLCNDWYYPSLGKMSLKDNRTQFIRWLKKLELKYSQI